MKKTSSVSVYLGDTKVAPYHEDAGARFHASVSSLVLGQLISVDSDLKLKPALLESFRWDRSANLYILKLKKGLKFHSGRKVTAKDLEFTLLRGFFSPRKNFYAVYLHNIKGLKEVAAKRNDFHSGIVSGVKVVDELTLHVELEPFNSSFLNALSRPYFSLVDREALKDDFITWKNTPIGAGPYKVRAPFSNGKLELTRHEQDESLPDQVILRTALHSGEKVDLSLSEIDSKHGATRLVLSKHPRATPMITFNFSNPIARETAFRSLVKSVVRPKDFDGLRPNLRSLEFSLPPRFLPVGFKSRASSPKHVEELKAELRAKGFNVEKIQAIAFPAGNLDPLRGAQFETLKKQFDSAGMKLTITLSDDKFMAEPKSRSAWLILGSQIVDYVDPLFMFSMFRSDSAFTLETPRDAKLDSQYNEISIEDDPAQRAELVRRLGQYCEEKMYFVRYAEEFAEFYFNESTIKGFVPTFHPNTLNLAGVIKQ